MAAASADAAGRRQPMRMPVNAHGADGHGDGVERPELTSPASASGLGEHGHQGLGVAARHFPIAARDNGVRAATRRSSMPHRTYPARGSVSDAAIVNAQSGRGQALRRFAIMLGVR